MKNLLIAAVAVTFAVATAATAHEYKLGDIIIDHPMAFETARTAQTAGGYLSVTNSGTTDDRLIAVEADFPRVTIHTTQMDGDLARMMELEGGVVVPAGETVTLAPGGMHVMFMGLGGDPFEVDEKIAATLVFENAGRLEVTFNVAARKADGHSDMDHGDHN